MSLHIAELHSYPVKSCAPLPETELALTPFGLAFDREWMVARPNGTFLSQRQLPELALVRTMIDDNQLVLSAPSSGSTRVPLERDIDREQSAREVTIFKKTGTAYDEGDEVADFFSDYLGKEVRLMRSAAPRPINPDFALLGASAHTRFADGFPLLVTSMASLAVLNEEADGPIPMNRFRANIVIDGPELEPYEEDYWREIQLADVRSFVVRACARCPIPDVVQEFGERDPRRNVSETLAATSAGIDPSNGKNGVFFGQNVVHVFEPGQTLAVGDPVEITQRAEQRNITF